MWTDSFEAVVREHITLPPGQVLHPDDVLANFGLDSMKTVSLLVAVERAFEVTFTDDMLVPDTFSTPGGLWAALSRLRGAGIAAGVEGTAR